MGGTVAQLPEGQIGSAVRFLLRRLPAVLIAGALGCAPARPPARPPVLVVASSPLRLVADAAGRRGGALLLVRAGSAYDPPGREGLSFVLAHGLAAKAGVEVEVGPELVRFRIPEGRAAALAAAFVESVDEQTVRLGVAAAGPAEGCAAQARHAALAWGVAGHPYGHRPEGRTSVLPTLRAGELQAFRQLRYVRDAAVLVAAPEADTVALSLVLPPMLSRSVTPAVALAPRAAGVKVSAPVSAGCAAWVLATPASWGAREEALLSVAARIVGDPAPPPRVDPVGVLSALPDADALRAGFAWARADVVAQVGAEAAEREAASLLLGSLRGGHYVPASALLAALQELTPEALVSWADGLRAGSVALSLVPEDSGAGAESGQPPRVPSLEGFFR